MNITFTGYRIVFKDKNNEVFLISLKHRIICFSISEKFIAVCEDWKNLESNQNLSIFDIKGTFLFKIDSAPKALYENFGFYSSVSFKTDEIVVIQSTDYRYEYHLEKRMFLNEIYTK